MLKGDFDLMDKKTDDLLQGLAARE